jgi:hypothetical protein
MHVWPNDNKEGKSMRRRVDVEDYIAAANSLGLEFIARPVQKGDMYLAGRNTGIKLLTAKEVDHDRSWIVPEEFPFYLYDTWECRAVIDPSQRH